MAKRRRAISFEKAISKKRKLVSKRKLRHGGGLFDLWPSDEPSDRARVAYQQMEALGGWSIGSTEDQNTKHMLRNHIVLCSYVPTNYLLKSIGCQMEAPYLMDWSMFEDEYGDEESFRHEDAARLTQNAVQNETGVSTLDLAIAGSQCGYSSVLVDSPSEQAT